MTEHSDSTDPSSSPGRPSADEDVDGGPDEGPDDGTDGGSDGAHTEGPAGAAPQDMTSGAGQIGMPSYGANGSRRRRRRRRRGRGPPVLFTPEGQAYRMVTSPDGQQTQVFLSPVELQQYQARMAQQQTAHQAPRPGGSPGGPAPVGQLAPVEGVLDTDVKGPNAFLRQIKDRKSVV